MEMKDIILSTLKEIEEGIEEGFEVEEKVAIAEQPQAQQPMQMQQQPKMNNDANARANQAMMSMTASMQQMQQQLQQMQQAPQVQQMPPQPQQQKNNNIIIDDLPSHYISTEEFMSNTTKPMTVEPTTSVSLAKSHSNAVKDALEDEKVFLNSVRERLLVLFEGLQSPNNRNIEAKVDLIINFLEYKLAVVDERLEKVQRTILSL